MLRQAEDADPNDPFTHGLRSRYNDLEAERRAIHSTIEELDVKDLGAADRPSVETAELLEALPRLAVRLDQAPEELLNHSFDLTQLTIQVHYRTGEATLKVTLPQDHIEDVAETAIGLENEVPEGCKTAGHALCASCACPRCGSYSIYTKPYPP